LTNRCFRGVCGHLLGDHIRIISKSDDGWWVGEKDGVSGHFPSMLVHHNDEEEEEEEESAEQISAESVSESEGTVNGTIVTL
jgi:hypothetical protein